MASKYLKPVFMIIGERKCGTSSLYRYMLTHPQILPCKIKEPQFFSRPWLYRQLMWRRYLALFPKRKDDQPVEIKWYKLGDDGAMHQSSFTVSRTPGVEEITGEASANTFAQVPPQRLYNAFPDLRLILLLRNPVERAFSHYRMLRRFYNEGRRIPFTPTDFTSDARREIRAIQQGKGRSYFVSPGIYVESLPKWLDIFHRDQIKIIRTSDLSTYDMCDAVLQQLYTFLRIGKSDLPRESYEHMNVAGDNPMPQEAREILSVFYRPYNIALEELLERKMGWDE